MKRVAELQARASTKKSKAVAAYTKNWRKIEKLLNVVGLSGRSQRERLKGLQMMDVEQDTSYTGGLSNQTGLFLVDAAMASSWIWKVPMLDQGSDANSASSMELVAQWEDEGMEASHPSSISLTLGSLETSMGALFQQE
jgi:hypothetical protein